MKPLRCKECGSEFAFVQGFTESRDVCYGCLHPSDSPFYGRGRSRQGQAAHSGGSECSFEADASTVPPIEGVA